MFAYTVGLWMFDLGFGVIDIVDGDEQLVVMLFRSRTIFRCVIGQGAMPLPGNSYPFNSINQSFSKII